VRKDRQSTGSAVKGEDEQWGLNNDIIQEEIKEQATERHISQQRVAVVEHNLSGLYSEARLFSSNEDNFYKRNISQIIREGVFLQGLWRI
jgi:hypothetical protein